jgi:hypothetical protein
LRVPQDYETAQDAIDAAVAGDEVVLSPGSYEDAFNVSKAITVRSTNPANPDVVRATIIDDSMSLYLVALSGSAIVDGLTLPTRDDEAVLCGPGTPTLRRCIAYNGMYSIIDVQAGSQAVIEDCEIYHSGELGAVDLYGNAAPTIRDNYFHDCARGGAISGTAQSNPTIENNRFINCGSTGLVAPALTIYNGRVANNTFRDCEGTDRGTISVLGDADIIGNLIVGCSAPRGGGIYCWTEGMRGQATIANNTLCDNVATQANGGGHIYVDGASPSIYNCIVAFAGGGGGISASGSRHPYVDFCDTFGNTGGNYVGFTPTDSVGNLSVDPRFVERNVASGAYRLSSTGGHWNGSAWVIDALTSACIDAGQPGSDFSLEPAPNGGRINMGYDGNTRYASKSGTAVVPSVITCSPRGTGINVAANIFARFSVPMKQASVQNNLYINGVKVTGGTFTWLGTKMTYNPSTNFQAGRRYQIRIAKAAQSKTGVRMAADKIWNFTTAPAAAPQVTVTALPVASGAQIALNLTAAADVTIAIRNLAGRQIALLSPGALEAGAHSLVWSGKSRTGTIVPAGSYLVKVTGVSADGTSCSAVGVLRR